MKCLHAVLCVIMFCLRYVSAEEIRKSIETLDRILDKYDSGSATKELQTDKKFIPQKAAAAAHMLASCMQSAGNHKLRKRSGNNQHLNKSLFVNLTTVEHSNFYVIIIRNF